MDNDNRFVQFQFPTLEAIEEIIDKKLKLIQVVPTAEARVEDKLLDYQAVMDFFQVSKSTIDNWRKYEKLPFIKIGEGVNAPVRFKMSDLNWFMEKNRVCLRV